MYLKALTNTHIEECDFDEDCCSGFCKFNAKVGSHCYGLKGTTTKSAIAGILGLAKEDEHEQAQKSVAQQADQLAAAKPPACLPDGGKFVSCDAGSLYARSDFL